jgi:limonene-1,2-epoxide hydrolase
MGHTPNIDLVLRHLEGFGDIERFIDSVGETAAADIEWFNSGFPTYYGLEHTKQGLKGFGSKFRGIRIECVNLAEDGNKVWTERIDYLINFDGTTAMALPCMGIFEIENGRIRHWRDYFDGSIFKS